MKCTCKAGRPAQPKGILSKREAQVFACVVRGLSNQDSAKALFVHNKTVKFHLTNIYKKLSIKSRGELIAGWYTNAFPTEKLTFVYPYMPKAEPVPEMKDKKELLPQGAR